VSISSKCFFLGFGLGCLTTKLLASLIGGWSILLSDVSEELSLSISLDSKLDSELVLSLLEFSLSIDLVASLSIVWVNLGCALG
jgi:hypothetical protein